MKDAKNTLAFILVLMFAISADISDRILSKTAFVGEAEAIIGVPLSPVSYAGVARRTTRRAVVATSAATTSAKASASAATHSSAPPPAPAAAPSYSPVPTGTIVPKLPEGCTSVIVNNATYSDCGGVFYKAAFQGNNLVYVVVEKPMQ